MFYNTLARLCRISFNDVFFAIVKLFDVFLDSIEQAAARLSNSDNASILCHVATEVLIGISALFAIGIVWKLAP